jgi:hypothetical protein
MSAPLALFALLALALAPSDGLAALHQQLSTDLLGTQFDFIIVGGA